MTLSSNPTTRRIRRYYDQNTSWFLALGSAQGTGAIHRSVWAPGVENLEAALNYTNELILGEAYRLAGERPAGRLRLADLGCGVGGTLFYLLPRLDFPVQALGLTISPVQARLARRRAQSLGLPQPAHFVEADFLAPPLVSGLDLAWSVEAFLHAEDPAAYFRRSAALLRPGGRLVVCDDFLTTSPSLHPPLLAPELQRQERGRGERPGRWLRAFQQGWHVPGLCSLPRVEALARESGLRLERNQDLTPALRLRALPEGLASALLALGQRIPLRHALLSSMLGSLALQQCLKQGWIEYRFLVFEKIRPVL